MTGEQIDSVVAVTGVERYRWLTSEANPDADSRERYRLFVAEKAASLADGPPSSSFPPNPHMDLLKLVRECEHAGPASCGCNAVRRCAIYNRDVGIGECLACVRDGGLEA